MATANFDGTVVDRNVGKNVGKEVLSIVLFVSFLQSILPIKHRKTRKWSKRFIFLVVTADFVVSALIVFDVVAVVVNSYPFLVSD